MKTTKAALPKTEPTKRNVGFQSFKSARTLLANMLYCQAFPLILLNWSPCIPGSNGILTMKISNLTIMSFIAVELLDDDACCWVGPAVRADGAGVMEAGFGESVDWGSSPEVRRPGDVFSRTVKEEEDVVVVVVRALAPPWPDGAEPLPSKSSSGPEPPLAVVSDGSSLSLSLPDEDDCGAVERRSFDDLLRIEGCLLDALGESGEVL